jgi:Na+-transporting NADH:ubiquinone oxidoreductase subunit C
MHSNKYILIYSTIMVVLVAVSLTFVAVGLKPIQEDNIRIEKMQNILASVHINVPPKEAITTYKKYVTEVMVINKEGKKVDNVDGFTVDMAIELKKPADQQNLPVFIATLDDGKKYSIVPVRGKGLWGPIWGYIALTDDFNTIYGVTFDHKGETPGLGAEINTAGFMKPFSGKQIFDQQGNFTSVKVEKGGAAPGDVHAVDAISGGTITSKGLEKMLMDCLASYEVYFKNKGKI